MSLCFSHTAPHAIRSRPRRERGTLERVQARNIVTKSVLGIVGGSGFYHLPGIENPHWEKCRRALGASPPTRSCLPSLTGCRSASCPATDAVTASRRRNQLPRQHRCPEARRRHRSRLGLGLRLARKKYAAGAFRAASTSSSTAPSRARRASSAPAASRTCRWRDPVSPLLVDAVEQAARAESIALHDRAAPTS